MNVVPVDRSNIPLAAAVHSVSWQESHRDFCKADFVALHTPERQEAYIARKMDEGSRFWMLEDPEAAGVVSVKDSLIEDLYVLPDRQNRGYGTALLHFAIRQCPGIPSLWILENNARARRLYEKEGFRETGNRKAVTGKLDEIELAPKIEYRAAGPGDIDQVMRTRLDTLVAVNGLENDHLFDRDFLEASRKFFLEGDQETMLAFAGARAVGCATMCYIRLMPTFSHPTGLRAHLMNVYTDRTWRRKGIAYHMVSFLIRRAWEKGATEISLDATQEGKKLYRKLGFTESCEGMTLDAGRMDEYENHLKNREEME